MSPRPSDLGSAELEVLTALWDLGPATVRQVLDHLHERGRKLAYTTVLTFLTRLEQKGIVASDKSGLAYVYRPKVTREKVTRTRLKSILETFYDGEAGPLVLQLVREGRLSAREIDELHTLIDELDASNRKGRRKR